MCVVCIKWASLQLWNWMQVHVLARYVKEVRYNDNLMYVHDIQIMFADNFFFFTWTVQYCSVHWLHGWIANPVFRSFGEMHVPIHHTCDFR